MGVQRTDVKLEVLAAFLPRQLLSRHGSLALPGDQIIDPAMARSLHADACRAHAAVAWAVLWDLPAYSERFAARAGDPRPLYPSCTLAAGKNRSPSICSGAHPWLMF